MPTASTTTNRIWTTWTYSSSDTATTDATWASWAESTIDTTTATSNGTTIPWGYWVQERELTAEEKAEQERRQREYQERQEQLRREQAEAEEKAKKLLEENLNAEQLKAYRDRKVIPFRSRKGRHYEIREGIAGNVYRLDECGKALEKYCIHPSENIPKEDVMLAQLLWLKWCEDDFLKIANRTQLAA